MAKPKSKVASKPKAKANKKGKAVVKKENLPAKTQQGARGMEDVTPEDLAIPRIKLLQDMSGEVKKRDERYVEGAEVGMFLNSVTNALYESLLIIPVKFYRKWLVWSSEDSDATLIAVMDDELSAKQATASNDEYMVMYTPTYIVLIINEDGSIDEASLPMPSTKIKIAKKWNSAIRMTKADMFAKVYELTATEESNAKGDFFNIKITAATDDFLESDDESFLQAESLWESLMAGERQLNDQAFSERDIVEGEEVDDDGIPF